MTTDVHTASAASPPRRSLASIALCVIALLALLAADLWTKEWAQQSLSQPRAGLGQQSICQADDEGRIRLQRQPTDPLVLIDGHLQFRYAENCGAAFGMLRDAPGWVRSTLFSVTAVGFSLFLLWSYVQGTGGLLFVISVPLMISGAVGNLVDRLHHGYVVDFIRYHGLFEYPTFNVADITIAIGGALLLVDGMRGAASSTSTERSEPMVT